MTGRLVLMPAARWCRNRSR